MISPLQKHTRQLQFVAFDTTAYEGFVYVLNSGPDVLDDATRLHSLTMLLYECLCNEVVNAIRPGLVVIHIMPNARFEVSMVPSDPIEYTTLLQTQLQNEGHFFILNQLRSQYMAAIASNSENADAKQTALVSVGFDTPTAIDRGDVTLLLEVSPARDIEKPHYHAFFNSSFFQL